MGGHVPRGPGESPSAGGGRVGCAGHLAPGGLTAPGQVRSEAGVGPARNS